MTWTFTPRDQEQPAKCPLQAPPGFPTYGCFLPSWAGPVGEQKDHLVLMASLLSYPAGVPILPFS